MIRLAWRYVACYRGRSAILAGCVAVVAALPLAVHLLLGQLERSLTARARATPLVVGAPGSRYDLLFGALHFRGEVRGTLAQREADAIRREKMAAPVPLFVRYTAKGYPVVGTTLDYFDRRALTVARGTTPLLLGDVCLGASVARTLGLGPEDRILSDVANLFDISGKPPLRMRVAGVLAPAGSADDWAVFTDLNTAYVIHGLCHGHDDVTKIDATRVLARAKGHVKVDGSVIDYVEVREDNLDAFHFHGDQGAFPLTGILLWPTDDKAATILKGRYHVDETRQLLVPTEVTEEFLALVLRIRRLFDAGVALVALATAVLFALVVALSLRLREGEVTTLRRIGVSRARIGALLATELAIVVLAGLLTAAAVAGGLAVVAAEQGWLVR